jgi:iron complex transport system substrate-binding protein
MHILRLYISLCVLFLVLACDAHAQTTIHDDLRRSLRFSTPPRRIVSLAPSITETLFAIGAGNQVVGVTDYCTYPPQARSKQRVGGVVNPNIEVIVGLQPDVIAVSMEGNMREDFAHLEKLGFPVFVSNPRTLDDIFRSIVQFGELTGRGPEAHRVADSLRERARAISSRARGARRTSLLLFVSLQPMIVVGAGTFMSELIDSAGGLNLAATRLSTYPTYSRETVLEYQPEALVFTSDIMRSPSELVALYPEWATLAAIKQSRIYSIDSDLISRPGPRAVDGLETLYRMLHHKPQ